MTSKIKTVIGGAFYSYFNPVELDNIRFRCYPGIYKLKNRNYTGIGYINAEDFIRRVDVKPWDYFKLEDSTIIYFIPPTSFNGSNLKLVDLTRLMVLKDLILQL